MHSASTRLGSRFLEASLVAICLAAWLGGMPASATEPVQTPNMPVAIAADTTLDGAKTRIAVTLSRGVPATAFVLERPDRAVIDLPEVTFKLPADAGRNRVGVVTSMRFGLVSPGRSRVVVDLAAPALPSRVGVEIGPDGLPRLVVELAKTDRGSFRKMAAASNREDGIRTTGSLSEAGERDRRPTIVLDAGHGGVDPGAIAPTGAMEKDIVLAFSERLRDTLAQSGRYRVAMSRDSDIFVPLDERVRRARAAGADLFVSIHADSIAVPSISGATVYTGAERASDVESATLAERENDADVAAGAARPDLPGQITDILQDLTQRETRGFSRRFSGQLVGEMGRTVRFSSHPQREAGFRVLRAVDMPSVLVELGYLSNVRDVEHLTSDDWRRQTAGAMADAIDRFFALRLAGSATAPVSP